MAPLVVPTVAIDVVRAIVVEAVAQGCEFTDLSVRFGLTAELLVDPQARYPVDRLRRLWLELPGIAKNDDFGLHVAHRTQAANGLGVVGYVVRTAATTGEALQHLLRYQRLLTEVLEGEVFQRDSLMYLRMKTVDPVFAPPRHAVEFSFASLLLHLRDAALRPLQPVRISFRHSKPPNDAAARALFGCPLQYDAPFDQVTFAPSDLHVPLRTADPYLASLLHDRAQQLANNLPGTAAFVARVRSNIIDGLPRGHGNITDVAKRLNMSCRSLQRRLEEEHTTFQKLRDDLRRELAVRYLEDGALRLQEIAFLLGFSEQSTFHHTFVKWTGQAPGAYRKTRAPKPITGNEND